MKVDLLICLFFRTISSTLIHIHSRLYTMTKLFSPRFLFLTQNDLPRQYNSTGFLTQKLSNLIFCQPTYLKFAMAVMLICSCPCHYVLKKNLMDLAEVTRGDKNCYFDLFFLTFLNPQIYIPEFWNNSLRLLVFPIAEISENADVYPWTK